MSLKLQEKIPFLTHGIFKKWQIEGNKNKKIIKDFQKRPRKNYITTCIFERGQKKKTKNNKKNRSSWENAGHAGYA